MIHVHSGKRGGFTLIELLVVVAIIALLISILLPSLSKARETAKTVQCAALLKQYALANHMYADSEDGYFVMIKDVNWNWPYWNTNQKYRELLGMVSTWPEVHAFPANMTCPNMPDKWFENNNGTGEVSAPNSSIYRTYGMNFEGTPSHLVDGSMATVVFRPGVPSPSQKLQQVDAADWIVGSWGANAEVYWDIHGDTGSSTGVVSYRHLENANAAFFDGHVAAHSPEEVYPDWNGSRLMWDIYNEGP